MVELGYHELKCRQKLRSHHSIKPLSYKFHSQQFLKFAVFTDAQA
ncbi:MAG: hypothetical protein RMZ69_18570 [Nostoc sp. ChiQUE01a]|nr:hypothetical protein [Nostoc sp. ChiQUE01a]